MEAGARDKGNHKALEGADAETNKRHATLETIHYKLLQIMKNRSES